MFQPEGGSARNFVLFCDIYSRMIYARPLKTKTGKEMVHAMKSCFKEARYSPSTLATDFGKFYGNVAVI